MTGLNPETDSILQIFCFITDNDLNLLDSSGWGTVVHHPKAVLDAMDEWCTHTHASTGLTAAVLASTVTPEEAASGLLRYIQTYIPRASRALLAGNSVHADRAFLSKPPYDKALAYLHYRIFDVSTIKEAIRRWGPDKMLEQMPRKMGIHEARQDILESIDEAKYYRKVLFSS
jgi:oligoribonuclease